MFTLPVGLCLLLLLLLQHEKSSQQPFFCLVCLCFFIVCPCGIKKLIMRGIWQFIVSRSTIYWQNCNYSCRMENVDVDVEDVDRSCTRTVFLAWKILHQQQILSLEINVLDDTMACRTSVWHNNTSIIGNQCMPVPHYSCTLYCILSRGLTSFILVMRKWFRSCRPFLIICFQIA